MPSSRRLVLYALAAVLSAAVWQALTIHYNFGGNWTALFCTGSKSPAPPAALASEHIYVFAGTEGYDGQFYHYIAHDPLLLRGFVSSIDAPRFRYRRILVPLLAWLAAAGRDRLVDRAYLAEIWLWVFAGALWTGLAAAARGAGPTWTLAFLAVPAVIVSLDRLTVDIALAALTAGIVYYLERRNWTAVVALGVAAGLTRESGLLIPAALMLWCILERRWARAIGAALALVPALAWYSYVAAHTPASDPERLLSPIPFAGIVTRALHPAHYPFGLALNALAAILDYAALAGLVAALVYCVVHRRRLARQPDGLMAFAFAALVVFTAHGGVWQDAYAFARGYSPLLLLVALDGAGSRPTAALPIALTAPRIALQLSKQALGVIRGIAG